MTVVLVLTGEMTAMFKRKDPVDRVVDELSKSLKSHVKHLIKMDSLSKVTVVTHEVDGVGRVSLSLTVDVEKEK